MDTPAKRTAGLDLDFPQSLAVYDTYDEAQRAVYHLSDKEFPVQNLMIVGTDLKRIERVTGRLSWGRVAGAGAVTGLWFGVFVGLMNRVASLRANGRTGVPGSCSGAKLTGNGAYPDMSGTFHGSAALAM